MIQKTYMFRSLQGRIRIVKNFFNYYIFKITKPSKSQYIVTLKPERKKKFKFKAGQYAGFSFAGEVTVPLSIASTPSSTSIELHINQQAPLSKKKYFKKYGKVLISGPYGNSYLEKKGNKSILAIAGGTGLAPIKSITETYLNKGGKNSIYLYHGAKNEENLYLEKYFRNLVKKYKNLKYIPVLSEPNGKTKRRVGYVTDIACNDFKDFRQIICYLAGPKLMIDSAFKILTKNGLKRKNIFSDQIPEIKL